MDAIRHWAFGACAAAVACGLIQLILPKSGMQRIFNVTASVFFLSCLLSPVLISMPGPEDFTVEREELQAEVERRSQRLSSAVEESQTRLAAGSVREAARRVLEELAVEGGKIYVNVHDLEGGGISISECEVQLPREYEPRHDEIRQALLARLGVNVLLGYDVEKE